MGAVILRDQLMGLGDRPAVGMDERFGFDRAADTVYVDFEGLRLVTAQDADDLAGDSTAGSPRWAAGALVVSYHQGRARRAWSRAGSSQRGSSVRITGVGAIADAARGGETPSGFLDTGVTLITGDPVDGVESRDVAFGVRNCWGS
jgi:hypothetical protein